MQTRKLGRTGIEVSEIGYGAWGIGGSQWGGADDDESVAALHSARSTSASTSSTRRLPTAAGAARASSAQVVRERSERVYVATKVPPKNGIWPPAAEAPVDEVFPGAHVRECAEQSLRNLGLDAIDLLQLHVWQRRLDRPRRLEEALEELRVDGKIRSFGISINDHQPANSLQLSPPARSTPCR